MPFCRLNAAPLGGPLQALGQIPATTCATVLSRDRRQLCGASHKGYPLRFSRTLFQRRILRGEWCRHDA